MTNFVQQKLDLQLKADKKEEEKSTSNSSNESKRAESERKKSPTPIKNNSNTNENESESTTSTDTLKTKTKSHHYNDNEENESWNESTQEDETNTVDLNSTSVWDMAINNKVTLPRFTCYQMMIQLDKGKDLEVNILDSKDKDKNPSQRVLEFLASFADQVRKADKDAKVMSWKTSPNFTHLEEEFPTNVAEVSRYFSGYRKNFKADKRLYIRVAIHTPNSQTKLSANLMEWMRLHGYLINKCIIQAETSTCIGWLCYSSQHTDTNAIKDILTVNSDFEWGFKMVSITEADVKLPWLEQARAVGIYVPTPCKDIAVNIIGEAFEASLDSQITNPALTDKFLFMEPERMYKGNKHREIYYSRMVERHRVHSESLLTEPSYGITVDLDKRFMLDPEYTKSEFTTLSVRDILLDLKVETPDHPMHGTNLFHSVGFFSDSSNLWLNGQKCDSVACCIFSYYDVNASEATTMVKGMGKMILKEFGPDIASKIFTLNHFKGNSRYRWSKAL